MQSMAVNWERLIKAKNISEHLTRSRDTPSLPRTSHPLLGGR